MKTLLNQLVGVILGLIVGFYVAKYSLENNETVSTPVSDTDVELSVQKENSQDSFETQRQAIALESRLEELQDENAKQKNQIQKLQDQLASGDSNLVRYTEAEDTKVLRETLVGELLELSHSKDLIEKTLQSSFASLDSYMGSELNAQQKQQMATATAEVFSWDKLEPAFYSIYTESFTANELQQINDFYRSETGQSLVLKTPEISAKTMVVIQETVQDSLPKLQQVIEDITKNTGETDKSESH